MSEQLDCFKTLVIRACEPEIYREVDGFYVFDAKRGFLGSESLRILADELDRRNAAWRATIDSDPALRAIDDKPAKENGGK